MQDQDEAHNWMEKAAAQESEDAIKWLKGWETRAKMIHMNFGGSDADVR